MEEREWQVGIAGTFDVENYGDLLFPLIAELELGERLGRVRLHRFGYRTKSVESWPYEVTSVAELPRLAPRLDGLLVGGGFLVRFDKEVAPGYAPPSGEIHHPTGYWLSPALLALQHGVPLAWNAPGMHLNALPAWAAPLLRLALAESACIAVRDEPTRTALAPFAGTRPIEVVPDTAFGLGRLLAARPAVATATARLREAAGLRSPYLVVQAAAGMAPFLGFLARHSGRLRDLSILALPLAPALGEAAAIVQAAVPASVRLPGWPHPLEIAELIRGAAAVAGHSYHLALTALTAGVPVFSPSGLAGKFSAFAGIDSIHPLPGPEAEVDTLLSRLGPGAPPPQVEVALARLESHWDRLARMIRAGRTGSGEAVGRFLQALPRHLEAAEERTAEAGRRADELLASTSWRATAPLRALGRRLR